MIEIDNRKYRLAEGKVKQAMELGFEEKISSPFHAQISFKNQMYLIAWPDTCQAVKIPQHPNEIQQFYTQLKLNKDSFLRQNISEYTSCYGGSILNNEIYFFVAKNQQQEEKETSSINLDIIKLNLSTGVYSLVLTTGQPPIARQQPLVETLSNMYLVMYGGFDSLQNRVCSDAYALIFKQWIKLKIINPIQTRHKFASTVLNGKIFVHGGQSIENEQKVYFNDLYALSFSDTKKQLIFQQIHPSSKQGPSERSGHKLTSVSSRYLLMFGGKSAANNVQEETNLPLNEFWLYDTIQNRWNSVYIDGFQKYTSRALYGLSFHLNCMYIFGEFNPGGSHRIVDLLKIEFPEQIQASQQTSLSSFYNCEKKGKDNLQGSSIELATSMIHTSSYLIRSPFQSMQRIIEFAEDQGAQNLRIHSESTFNTIEKYIYISIDFDLKKDKANTNCDLESQVQKLFIYCLRMGKTVVLVHNKMEEHERKVFLISADGRFSPLLQRLQLFYSYSQINLPHELPQVENAHSKEIIHKILEGLIQDPQKMLRSIDGFRILIFAPNIIPTPKSYYYEMVFDSLNDISVFKNNKKLELLLQIKYDLGTSMEFSLNSYLKYANSNKPENNRNKTQVFISKSLIPVPQNQSYAQYLAEFQKANQLIKLNIPSSAIKFTDSFELFACEQDFYLPENNGILLYQNGKLVNRYECEFGRLLLDKFYHKKYHRDPHNIFVIVGQIHLSNELTLINFRTEFQKNNKYIQFQFSLEKSISQALHKVKPSILTKKNKNKPKEQKSTTNQQKPSCIDPSIVHPFSQLKLNEGTHIQRQPGVIIEPQDVQISEQNSNTNGKKVKTDNLIKQVQEE